MSYIITYDTLKGSRGRKSFSGMSKAEAKYKFKFLYPDYLILEIINDFYEDSNIKNTAETGDF